MQDQVITNAVKKNEGRMRTHLYFNYLALGFAIFFLAQSTFAIEALPKAQSFTLTISESNDLTEGLVEKNIIRLLNWISNEKPDEPLTEDYNRMKQFGRWVQFKKTKGCYDTRAQVLIRDSVVKAESTDDKKCTIEKGEWHDPYSGQVLTQDSDVQIDHMVPLKAAYSAGASTWSRAKKCVYANFTAVSFHLISTSNFENQSKSDKSPEDYIPPNKDYVCTYLKNWLSVKLIWKLKMTESEAQAISNKIKEYNCNPNDFFLQRSAVQQARDTALQIEKFCPISKIIQPVVVPEAK